MDKDKKSVPNAGTIITLNVGGQIFATSYQTITRDPDSMLARMFSNPQIGLHRDAQGNVFIDRDGAHFRYILNFLRDGFLDPMPSGLVRRELLREADFYQIKKLIDLLTSVGPSAPRQVDLLKPASSSSASPAAASISSALSAAAAAASAMPAASLAQPAASRADAREQYSTSPPKSASPPPLASQLPEDFEFTPQRVGEVAFEVLTKQYKEQYDKLRKEFMEGCKAAALKGRTGFALQKNGWSMELEDMCSALTYEMRQLGFNAHSKRVEASGKHYLEVRMQWMPPTPYYYYTTSSTFHQVEILNWPDSLQRY